ncbi:hypothetical protein [Bacillus gaemokensis]|uniref:Uncharacterized protein n=1 Tax=Bacillus gaemokensis TaxID=574375 RepID=A0A073KBB6_9BACI|nr:hypothetical protein [Bacillus gaemokensis]KEK23752.1 hypothetical protein BAGA_07270 [Bacillus gaemokensis]KYG26542.1 hypothetical protein AZF08_17310 [Bacillus gaemokensis]
MKVSKDERRRVDELEKRIANLEKQTLQTKSSENIGLIRMFGEGIMSLVFGILIVGPVIAIVYALVVLFFSLVE